MTIFQKRTTPQRIVFAVVFVIFSLYALSLLYPFIWAFYNSMKTMDEYRDNTFSLPIVLILLIMPKLSARLRFLRPAGEKWGWFVCF